MLGLLRISEVEIQVPVEEWHCEPYSDFCEGFTEADTTATHERCKGNRVPWLAIDSQSPLVVLSFCVESLGNKALRLRPLVRILMHAFDQESEGSALLDG